ncbi:hypothetical protein QBC32DRAFT_388767, partial [Pseudoneurospora amorphoporcata]
RSLISAYDPANRTSLTVRVGANFRFQNPPNPDNYRASASRADRAVCSTTSEPYSRLAGPNPLLRYRFRYGLFYKVRCRFVGPGIQDIPGAGARADGRLREASGLRARRPASQYRPFNAAVRRINRNAAVRRSKEEAVASLASGEGYKDTRVGGKVGKVSPLVRPDNQERSQRLAVRGVGI